MAFKIFVSPPHSDTAHTSELKEIRRYTKKPTNWLCFHGNTQPVISTMPQILRLTAVDTALASPVSFTICLLISIQQNVFKNQTFPPSLPTADKKKSGVNFVFHVQQHLGRQEKLKQCLQRRRCCMGKCKAMTMHKFTSRRSWRSPRPALTKWLLAPDRGGRKTHNHIKDYMTTLQQLCSTGISLAHTDLHL